jgi:lactate dehydrogenase-like 2-hydroxyacid dehydrogenase
MSLPKVLVTRTLPGDALKELQRQTSMTVWEEDVPIPRGYLLQHIQDVEGVLCLLTDHIDADVLSEAPSLKVVSTMAVGFDHIDVQACTGRGIPVGHTPGILTDTTADLAFSLLLCAARRVVEGVNYVKAGRWTTWSPTLLLGQDIHSATLGVIGFGRIGRAMCKRATGFSMRVLVTHSSPISCPGDPTLRVQQVPLDTLLQEADFVSLHVPLTPSTYHLLNASAMERMKSTAVLINTSRGGIVDTEALFDALLHQKIGYAALDVTDPEPLPPNHPLLSLANCLVVPHIASASVATRGKMATMAVANLLSGLRGDPLPDCVNPEVYQQH